MFLRVVRRVISSKNAGSITKMQEKVIGPGGADSGNISDMHFWIHFFWIRGPDKFLILKMHLKIDFSDSEMLQDSQRPKKCILECI